MIIEVTSIQKDSASIRVIFSDTSECSVEVAKKGNEPVLSLMIPVDDMARRGRFPTQGEEKVS